MESKNCPPFPPVIDGAGDKVTRYALPGPQVEPLAAYWAFGPCETPCVVRIADLLPLTDDPDNEELYFEPYPSDPAVVAAEIDELRDLASRRDDPLPADVVSKFLQICPQPVSAVYCTDHCPSPVKDLRTVCEPDLDNPVIRTGRELGRWFEAETPGLGHRHALNCLISQCSLSPPRQARIWMALDVAIYSALLAAWYYKWGSDRPCTVYRPRPVELEPSLDVLYDRCPAPDGCGDDGQDMTLPTAPGTPRHPAYPSGHSTVGGAASEILAYFFPDHEAEIRKLGENAGEARLWAGVHCRSDHEQGAKLGRSVARVLIAQLERDGVLPIDLSAPKTPPDQPTPDKEAVRRMAYRNRARCYQTPAQTQTCPPLSRVCDGGEQGIQNVQQGAR